VGFFGGWERLISPFAIDILMNSQKTIKRVVSTVIPKNDPSLPFLLREYNAYRKGLISRVQSVVRPVIKDKSNHVNPQQKWMVDTKLTHFLANLPFHPMPFHRQAIWLEQKEQQFFMHFRTGQGELACRIKIAPKFRDQISKACGPNNPMLRQTELVEDQTRQKIRVHIGLQLPKKKPYKPDGWVGVDIGWNHLATTAFVDKKTGKASHVTFHGENWKERILNLKNLLRQHQRTKKATKVWRHRLANVTRNAVGETANEIVKKALQHHAGVNIEKLSFPSHTRRWLVPRYKLKMAIKAVCEREGVPLREVSAAYTSQICNRCKNKKSLQQAKKEVLNGSDANHVETKEEAKAIRRRFRELISKQRRGKRFFCRDCGYQADSDANAAISIAKA
jgi:hypothetical protein